MNRSFMSASAPSATRSHRSLRQFAGLMLLALSITFCDQSTVAQGGTGFLPFTSHQQGIFDSVELSSLNVNFSIPIVQKTGRGVPFNYVLGYNSNIYFLDSLNHKWVAASSTYGWGSGSEASMGYVTYTADPADCPPPSPTGERRRTHKGIPPTPPPVSLDGSLKSPPPAYGSTTIYSDFKYHDPIGGVHDFPNIYFDKFQCLDISQQMDDYTPDGSGYYMIAARPPNPAIVYPRSGGKLTAPLGAPSATGTVQDRNGNYVSSAIVNNNLQFIDTLNTDPSGNGVLTVSGAPPTVTYTHKGPSGNQQIQAHYTAQNIQTSFGCSGVNEYSATGQYLLTSISFPDGSQYSFTYYGDGRIHTATLRTGGTITYSYPGAHGGMDCTLGGTLSLNRTTPDSPTAWSYTRSGTGNATTTILDAAGNQTVLTFSLVTKRYETQHAVYQGTSTLLQTTNTSYSYSTGNYPVLTQLTKTTVYPNNVQSQTITKFDTFTDTYSNTQSHGLPVEIDEYDNGVGGRGSLLRQTLITYASLGNYIADRPYTVTIKNGALQTVAQTTYNYDQYSLATSGSPHLNAVTGSRGNATTVSSLVNPGTLNKSFTYYNNGLVNAVTDVNSAITTYQYGACGASFPTEIDMPLSLSQTMAWDCNGGVTTDTYDENQQHTHYDYDALWRTVDVTDPLSNVTTISYSNPPTRIETHLNNFNNNASTVDVFTTLDSLGRTHLTQRRQSPTSNNYDSVETDYDSLGRVLHVTRPYVGMLGQGGGQSNESTTVYDALGRATSSTWATGDGYTYSYTGNDILSTLIPTPTGENPKKRQFEFDGLGRLTSVCEVTTGVGICSQGVSQSGYWTKYTYDALGDLTSVLQNAQGTPTQSRTYAYDGLGRMTTESNPENGNKTYYFDNQSSLCGTSNGDLTGRLDVGAGTTTCFGYDAIHRVTAAGNGNMTGSTARYFVYDSALVGGSTMSYAKARLAEAYTVVVPNYGTRITDEGFSYNQRGELTDLFESTPHSGGYYHLTAQYWANGASQSLSGLPGMPTITYNVDGEGRPYTVSATSGQNPVSNTTFFADGQVNTLTFGSQDSDAFLYNGDTGLMTRYTFSVGASPLTVIGNLGWNANATLGSLGITDGFNSGNNQSCTFTHDDLLRVNNAHCGSVWSQDFSYDAFGNITKSGSIAWNPGYSPSTNHYTLGGTSYDANGNLTNDTFHTYTWDANWGNVLSVDTVGLTYDALGRMVEQNRSGNYTQVAYGPAGQKALMFAQVVNKAFVPLPAGAEAVYTSSGLAYYRHPDWLGSSRFASTPTRTMYTDQAYAPFGENYAATGTKDLDFTGQIASITDGLYDFWYREYHPKQGRWISPDPAGLGAAHPSNPQTWNRYVYVGNMALSRRDIDGRDFRPDGTWWGPVPQNWTIFKWKLENTDDKPVPWNQNHQKEIVNIPGRFGLWFFAAGGLSPYPGGDSGTGAGGNAGGAKVNESANNGTLPNGDVPIYGVNGWGQQILSHPTLQTAASTMTDPRTYALWTAAAAVPGVIYNWGALSAAGSELWMNVEAASPGATLRLMDVINVATPPWNAPTTLPGAVSFGWEVYDWWKH